MSDFKSRLLEEQAQLKERYDKLKEFNNSDRVITLNDVQRSLLRIQEGAMRTYYECLKARIERL